MNLFAADGGNKNGAGGKLAGDGGHIAGVPGKRKQRHAAKKFPPLSGETRIPGKTGR